MKFKFLPACFVLSMVVAPAGSADDRYDELGRVLKPFVSLLTTGPRDADRALELTVRIEQMTGLPDEWKGARAEFAIEYPDKLRLHGPVLGETMTMVRDGKRIWIYPGAKARALLDAKAGSGALPPPDKEAKLTDFRLPIPEEQLIFLPVLFEIKDLGIDPLDGIECRVLDFSLRPEIAKSVGALGWVGRVWIKPDSTPARLTLARSGWNGVLRFERAVFAPTLPESRWKPSAEEADDVLELSPKEYGRFLRALGGLRGKPGG
ncbi:MAG: hypothetical protein ABI680_09905 [Chthoniobacteraceae bacterium]